MRFCLLLVACSAVACAANAQRPNPQTPNGSIPGPPAVFEIPVANYAAIDLTKFNGGFEPQRRIDKDGRIPGFSQGADGKRHIYIFQDGNMTDKGPVPTDDTAGGYNRYFSSFVLNCAGDLAGVVRKWPQNWSPPDPLPPFYTTAARPFLFRNGSVTEMPPPSTPVSGAPARTWSTSYLTEFGQIVGHTTFWLCGNWGQCSESGVLPFFAPAWGDIRRMHSINRVTGSGDMIGIPYPPPGGDDARLGLYRGGNFTALTGIEPYGLNNLGQVVGLVVAGSEDGQQHATLWESGQVKNFYDLIPRRFRDGVHLWDAIQISDSQKAILRGEKLETSEQDSWSVVDFLWERDPQRKTSLKTISSPWRVYSILEINDQGRLLVDLDWSNRVTGLLLPAELTVDANRDGEVTLGRDTTSQAKPFRFWVNDDDDQPDGTGKVPVQSPDNADALCEGGRDLEDFTRLHLSIGGLHDAIRNGDIQVGMEWKNVTGSPAVWLYRSYDRDGSDSYLKQETAANNQAGGIYGVSFGKVAAGQPLMIDKAIFQGLAEAYPKTCLLFEGAGEGKGQLVFTLWKGGQKIGDGPGAWLDLVNVKAMYERAKATPNDIAQPQDSVTTPSAPSIGYVLDPYNHQWNYPAVSWRETKEYVVAVHGWNVTYDGARTFFAETTFKRMWQRGYKGRFAALYWSTLVGLDTYNESEYRAWFFGESLKQYVNSLPADYSKHLMAHSMGNIVAGSALRKGMSVENYALIDAAVPASCYDDNPGLHKSFGSNSPDHDTDPATSGLAYKNKLSGVGGNLINFYLASDDALDLWRLNQENFRPQFFYTAAGGDHAYKYYPGNPSGQKLFLTFVLSSRRNWVQLEESLAYAAKSSTLAVGAEGNAAGAIDAPVNLASFGYEDEHSAPWAFTLQKMKTFYDRLMDELDVERSEQ